MFINELNIRQFDTNANNYIYMTEQVSNSNRLNIILIIDLILLSVIIVLKMTSNMINPIIKLSHSAEDMSKGLFNTDDIVVTTNDEIEILAGAFNRMKLSIHTYIEELKEKAYTEAKLKDQQMENLKMQSLLDNARLYALQSQMNPHFLFNTINAGVQLSMIEGAERTSEFLESMSRLFRYNLKQLDKTVTIKDEVDNIKDYYELLKVRFGDLITFQFNIDESALIYHIPPLILQPIVENAYIHGLSKIEEGGIINVQILNGADESLIVIEDSGVGITRIAIKGILNTNHDIINDFNSDSNDTANSNGIGMRNVIERLELFYHRKGLLTIKGHKNEGTKVSIIVPHKGV
jgi:sensor histidine kinase YesM